ncbi:MAG: acyl-CoA dehydrogenase, partial [Myxococcota bacterium]
MHFDLTDEQRMLGESVQRFVKNDYGFEARQAIVASDAGWSRAKWQQMAELGILALEVPESQDGLAPAPTETLLTLSALGRAAIVEPFVSSAVVSTVLLRELGDPNRRLPGLASGEAVAVFAHGEPGARWQRDAVSTTATKNGSGWTLSGTKSMVLHAPAADLLLVSARTDSGVGLFEVAPATVAMRRFKTVDGQVAADVELSGEGALVRESAQPAIDRALEQGIAAVCAEAVGTLESALEATVSYTKDRKQFGVPIASFQALQHRMADMLIHVEQARSMSILAM